MSDLNIAVANSIVSARNDMGRAAAGFGRVFTYFTSTCITGAGGSISAKGLECINLLKSAYQDLNDAATVAYALADTKRKYSGTLNVKYSVAIGFNTTMWIRVDTEGVKNQNIQLNNNLAILQDVVQTLKTAYKQVSAVKAIKQLVGSFVGLEAVMGLYNIAKKVLVDAAIKRTLEKLSSAEKKISRVCSYTAKLSLQIISRILDFEKVDGKAKLSLYKDVLSRSSLIRDEKTARADNGKTIQELEKAQADYKALYGVESAEIAAEIARLRKLSGTEKIHLSGPMGQSTWNQHTYEGNGRKGMCCATAYAIGLSIVNNKTYDPKKYHYGADGGYTHYDDGGVGKYQNIDYSKIYDALKNGKPTMYHYKYTYQAKEGKVHHSQHWVLINGIREGADPKNLKPGDFTAIDPGYGKEYSLDKILGRHSSTPAGMKIFK